MKKRLFSLGLMSALAGLSACVIVPDGPLTGPNAVPGGPGGPAGAGGAGGVASLNAKGSISESSVDALLAGEADAAKVKSQTAALEGLNSGVSAEGLAELTGEEVTELPAAGAGGISEGATRRRRPTRPKAARTPVPTPPPGQGGDFIPQTAPSAVVPPAETPRPVATIVPPPPPPPTPAPIKTLISSLVAGSGYDWPTEMLLYGRVDTFDGKRGNNAVVAPGGLCWAGSGKMFLFTDKDEVRYFYDDEGGYVGSFTGGYGAQDGTFAEARFKRPHGIALAPDGSHVAVADTGNHAIRLLDFTNKTVSTIGGDSAEAGFADGDFQASKFNEPWGLVYDSTGNLYVADKRNHAIRKRTPDGVWTTLAGNGRANRLDGRGSAASLILPEGICIDGQGNLIFTESSDSGAIRKVSSGGDVTTLLTGVPGPSAIDVDAAGDILFATSYIAGDAVASDLYAIIPDVGAKVIAHTSINGNFIGDEGLVLMPDGNSFYYTHTSPKAGIYRAEYK